MTSRDQRIARLLRWYPPSWRETHEDEFTSLLEDSISDRPFWAHRGLDIAFHGSRLRLASSSRRLSAQPVTPMSPALAGFAIATSVFVGYAALFATTGLIELTRNTRGVLGVGGLVVAIAVVAFALFVAVFGAIATSQTRSFRAGWPSLALGVSLIAAVGSDWWFSSVAFTSAGRYGGILGWWMMRYSVISINPFAWQSAYSNFLGPIRGDYRLYLPLNLCLLAIIATSSAALVRRIASTHGARVRARRLRSAACAILLATVASTWWWAMDLVGGGPVAYQKLLIPFAVTVAAICCVMAYFRACRVPSRRENVDEDLGPLLE